VNIAQVQAIVAVAAAGWYPEALRKEQVNNHGIRPILEEVEIRQCIECNDITDRSPTYK
jgi:hypothetical protein